MKRYMLFTGPDYYPSGGWGDFFDSYDTAEQAALAAMTPPTNDWWNVVDSTTGEMVADGDRSTTTYYSTRPAPGDELRRLRDSETSTIHSTADSMPPANKWVLAFVPEVNGAYGTWFIARWFSGWNAVPTWIDDSRDSENLPTPTHWMPLPPTPPAPETSPSAHTENTASTE